MIDKVQPMQTRRTLLATLAAVAAAAGAECAHADAAGTADAFIDKLMHELAAVVNAPDPLRDRQIALEKLIDSNVDVTEVARFCLGRFWRVATPQQQREYLELFHRVLVGSVTERFGEYKGVTYSVGHGMPRDETVSVPTIVNRPGTAPNKLEWVVSMANGSPKIIDVIAEGVSLRLTQRSDYASYLQRNNNDVQSLIEALRRQANNPQS
jgi:phospholipid transport system substrate-binding protein